MRNYRPTRPQHRAKSHDQAHVDEETDFNEQQSHPLVFHGDTRVVTTQEELLALIQRLRQAGRFAYDSEFIGELTYLPKLCLIQTATAQEVTLIDPLSEKIILTPFWELVADASVEKITHAGQQDLEPIIRHLDRPAQNVFDTQICAGFAGMAYPVALTKLVREIVGVRLGKGLTFSHWDQRPLSNQQIRYAANDVRYLIAAREELGTRLKELNHEEFAAEECAAQCDVGLYRFDPETSYLRVRGANGLPPEGLAVLKELVKWRDSAARQHDVPPRAFLRDEILIDMSRDPIRSVEKLNRVRGLPRPVEEAYGAQMVEATRRGLATPVEEMPESRTIEESPTDKQRGDSLWALTQCLCIGQKIDPDLVTSRNEIGRLLRHLQSDQPIDDLRLMNGWRRRAISERLLRVLEGQDQITLSWNEDGLAAG